MIDDASQIGTVVRTFDPGDQVVVEYTRDGAPGTVEVTLGENPGTDVAENRGAAYLGVSSRGVVEWEVFKHTKVEGDIGADSNGKVGVKMEWDY